MDELEEHDIQAFRGDEQINFKDFSNPSNSVNNPVKPQKKNT